MGTLLLVGHQMIEGDADYYPLFGYVNYSTGKGNDSDNARAPVSLYGIITQVYVTLCSSDGTPSAPGEGTRYLIRLQGTSNQLSVYIEDDETSGTARGMSVIEPGDAPYFAVDRLSGAPQRHVRISVVLWTPTINESHISGHWSTYGGSPMYAGMGMWSTTYIGDDHIYMPCSGTLSHLYCRVESAPGSGKTLTYTLMKNGSPTSVTCSITGTDKEGSDIVHSDTFVATDMLAMRCETAGGVSISEGDSYSLKAVIQNHTFVLAGGMGLVGAAGYDYGSVSGMLTGALSTGVHKTACYDMTVASMFVKAENAPAAEKTIVFTLVKETDSSETDTALEVTLSEGETEGDITTDVAIAKGDTIHVKRVRDGPVIGDNFWVGIVCEVTHTGPTVTTDKVVKGTATGTVSAIGDGSTCSVRGFCYKEATSGDPNVFDDTVVDDGSVDDGEFAAEEYSLDLSLVTGKLYRVRAFAISDTALSYGTTIPAYFTAPSDAVARVSSIRRVYRPGLYRMEVALGDLGFNVDVSEAAIKKVPDEVTEPEVPAEGALVPEDEPITPADIEEIIRWQKETFPEWYTPPPDWATRTTAPFKMPPSIKGEDTTGITRSTAVPVPSTSVSSMSTSTLQKEFDNLALAGQKSKAEYSRMYAVLAELKKRGVYG